MEDKPSTMPIKWARRDGVNGFGWDIYAEADTHWMRFVVIEVVACDADGVGERYRKVGRVSRGTDNPDAAEHCLSGTLKWDGCIDLDIGDDRLGSYRTHWCGPRWVDDHAEMLRDVYRMGCRQMSNVDVDLVDAVAKWT